MNVFGILWISSFEDRRKKDGCFKHGVQFGLETQGLYFSQLLLVGLYLGQRLDASKAPHSFVIDLFTLLKKLRRIISALPTFV